MTTPGSLLPSSVGLLALVGLLTGTCSTATHAQTLRTVALTGDQAPDADPGVLFGNLAAPALNNSGKTAFFVALTGAGVTDTNDLSIYSEGTGALAQVTRTGNQAPGASPGVLFSGFNNLLFNNSGQTAFVSGLAGAGVTESNEWGIYSEGTGVLAEVAREGNQVPGAEPGVLFADLTGPLRDFSDPLVLNDLGQTAFFSFLAGPGVDRTNDSGVFRAGAGAVTEIAREGDPAPGFGSPFVQFEVFRFPTLNDTGQIAFLSAQGGSALSVYSDRTGVLAPVALAGDRPPGTETGVIFDRLGVPLLNDSGQIAFAGFLIGPGVDDPNARGVYSDRTGTLAEVAREGNQAPGAGPDVLFNGLASPAFNNAGQTAFYGFLTGAGVTASNNAAVYSEGTGELAEVAREGSQAPGAEPGVLFSGFDIDDFLDTPVLNDLGQVAFVGELTGAGVDATNDTGIYATDRDGVLNEIARTGGRIDVNDDPLIDDFRTIADLSFLTGTDDVFNRSSGLNDLGQIAFRASFTDGSSGVFVSNLVAVPEPSTLLLTLMAAAGTLRRRR